MVDLETIEKTEIIKYDPENNSKIRIDKFLANKFPDYSRSYFQNLIDNGLILVNDKINYKESYSLRNGDIITINFPVVKTFDLTPQKIDFETIDVQKDFIVINKPAGLIVHPAGKTSENEITLVNGLLYKFEELNKFSNKERPGIVHRIDKDTSGLLLVARNTISQFAISKMFKDRLISKTYLAVVKGHPPKTGKIDYPLGRHQYKRHIISHITREGKQALTFYEVLEYYKESALVSVRIITGRTHQIRAHFAAIGHGLLGDKVYGYESKHISRQALHAWKISFTYKDTKHEYCANIPEDIQNLLKNL